MRNDNPQDSTWNAFELEEEEALHSLPVASPVEYIYDKARQAAEVIYSFPDSFLI